PDSLITIYTSTKASSVIWEVIHPLTFSLQRADTVPKLQLSLPSRTAQRITRSRSSLSNPLVRQLMSRSSYFLGPAVVALPGLVVPIRQSLIRHVTLPLTRRPVPQRK